MAARPKEKTENGTRPEVLERARWQDEIDRACRRYGHFHTEGESTVKRYRLEKENVRNYWMDKYNILYSSTETIRPSLYAQTPRVQATKRHRDRENEYVTLATMLLEVSCQYALEEIDFDDIIGNVISDYLLPGMGVAWVRYEPQFTKVGENDNDAYETLTFEGLALDYVHYKDFLTSDGRTEQDIWWKARRVYYDKKAAKQRFGKNAEGLSYTYSQPQSEEGTKKNVDGTGDQAVIYEIWNKRDKEVIWFSPDYPDGLLDKKPDYLKLKNFFPCPRPARAVVSTDTYIPQSFYSQYRQQAETLDDLTQRIRYLTKALRVVGVYDSSQTGLAKLLAGNDNRMVPIEDWTAFAGKNGINGAVQFLPIKDIAAVLTELYRQREIAKAEIYEITGFSDIVRGVSKASETLGAQQIKNDWAGGRLRGMQKEIQRLCRDIIRIFAEIISEHFSDESLALYAGFEPPPITPEEQQAAAQYAQAALGAQPGMPAPQKPPPTMQQQAIETFTKTVDVLRNERQRCALVGIETDSTIQPDEAQERSDRLEFLGQIGAFLQQAGPMALQYPDMRGLLGAIMMFAVRTFRASRPIEKEFEQFTKQLAQQPAMPPPGSKDGQGGQQKDPAAEAQAKVQVEQAKGQISQAEQAQDLQMEKYKVDQQEQTKRMKMQQEHDARMKEYIIKERELAIKERELGIKYQQEQRAEKEQEFKEDMSVDEAHRADRQLDLTAAEKAGGKED